MIKENIEIRLVNEKNKKPIKELYLFGKFQTSWSAKSISDEDIINYAITESFYMGRLDFKKDIKELLS